MNKYLFKKWEIILLIIFLFGMILIPGFSTIEINKNKKFKANDYEKKNWTLMLYDDRDFYDAPYITRNLDFPFLSNVHSGTNLNVIILQDTYYHPGAYFKVNKLGGRKLLEKLGEVNMGDYSTLKNFILFCKKNFPAERYFLDIFDHGGGWAGACFDETNNSWLTMKEINRALSESGGVDIISFIAPCLMATIEGVYELRNNVDVYIGKQPNSYFSIQIIGPLCNLLNNNHQLNNIEIGEKVIDFFKEKVDLFPWSLVTGKTLSSMRADMVEGLVKSINNFSILLINSIDNYVEDIRNIIKITETFPTRRKGSSFEYQALYIPELVHVDIYDFVKNCLKIDDLKNDLKDCIYKIMEGINKTIIAEHHTNDHPNAHGLSIYLGEVLLKNNPIDDYMNSGLDFSNDTNWDEFLEKYHSYYPTVDDDGNADYHCIQDAINNCSDGDVVYIKKGIYYENILVNKSILLVGESSNNTIIEGIEDKQTVKVTSNGSMLYFLGVKNSKINEFNGICIFADKTIIRKCSIYNSHVGLNIINSSYNKIFNSDIKNNSIGISIKNSNKNNFIYNNLKGNNRDAIFEDSFKNNWKNYYLDNPNKRINIVYGYRTFGNTRIPWINLNWFPKIHIF